MSTRFMIFWGIFSLIFILSTAYLTLRWPTRFPFLMHHRYALWFFAGLFVAVQVLGPMLYRSMPNEKNFSFILQWITYSSMGAMSLLFVFTIIGDLIAWIGGWMVSSPVDFARRSFFGVAVTTGVATVVGGYQAIRIPRVKKVKVPIQDLPADLHGYRIAQISDLHVGPTIQKGTVEGVVKKINDEKPDMVALTGDLLDGSVEKLREAISPLKDLKSRHGSFFVTGNHEYYWGINSWMEEFRSLGFRILQNNHEILTEGSRPLVVGGVPDPQGERIAGPAHRPDIAKAFSGAPESSVRVLLYHRPTSYEVAEQANVNLQLSGHTHAGQYFPWNLIVAAMYEFYKGLNRYKNMWIYVSTGTGYWGPPNRFLVPSEITLLELVPA